jgi:hypothetical protein
MGEARNVYILVGNLEGKTPLGRLTYLMCLKETGREGVDWIHLAQDRVKWRDLMKKVMDLVFHKRRGMF